MAGCSSAAAAWGVEWRIMTRIRGGLLARGNGYHIPCNSARAGRTGSRSYRSFHGSLGLASRKYQNRFTQSTARMVFPHATDTEVSFSTFGASSLRHSSTSAAPEIVPAVVVGGGPAGIAVLGNLLEKTEGNVTWVDPFFEGGRIHRKYREVPSNTRVNLFLSYAKAVEPFRQAVDATPTPNAITALEKLEQDKPCSLSHAADMLQLLSEGLGKNERVQKRQGEITEAEWNDSSSTWSITLQSPSSKPTYLTTPKLVLCTGASPRSVPLPTPPTIPTSARPKPLDLDTALKPSLLTKLLPRDRPLQVGLIGSSHSAILVLHNLFQLTQTTHPDLRIAWFSRSPSLRYAQYMDGWILYDNTGLKGSAATFAAENLEGEKLAASPVGKVCERVDCSGGREAEKKAFEARLPGCEFVVQAVGYEADRLPEMRWRGRGGEVGRIEPGVLRFDHERGTFVYGGEREGEGGKRVEGLFGAGIAFPERVVDKAGNVEYAVGFFKFMNFLKKVVPAWVGEK